MNTHSPQYVAAEKTGNLLAEKNTKIEQQTARIAELERQLEAVVMWPDVKKYISAQYPGLIKQIEAALKGS